MLRQEAELDLIDDGRNPELDLEDAALLRLLTPVGGVDRRGAIFGGHFAACRFRYCTVPGLKPGQHDEPEGILPDGAWTLVESDRESFTGKGSGHVDIWKLSLDGRKHWERLTYFNKYPGYKASNPVVSDDGRFMAFQMARSRDPAGVGYGIFLYDFVRAGPGR